MVRHATNPQSKVYLSVPPTKQDLTQAQMTERSIPEARTGYRISIAFILRQQINELILCLILTIY